VTVGDHRREDLSADGESTYEIPLYVPVKSHRRPGRPARRKAVFTLAAVIVAGGGVGIIVSNAAGTPGTPAIAGPPRPTGDASRNFDRTETSELALPSLSPTSAVPSTGTAADTRVAGVTAPAGATTLRRTTATSKPTTTATKPTTTAPKPTTTATKQTTTATKQITTVPAPTAPVPAPAPTPVPAPTNTNTPEPTDPPEPTATADSTTTP
jgi:hypothetical protein